MKTYNVQECSQFLSAAIEKNYIFRNITVRGTISGWHSHFSGITFFSLVDKERRISCFIGRMHHGYLTRKLESGLEASFIGDLRYDDRMGRPVLYVTRVLAIKNSERKNEQEKLILSLTEQGFFDHTKKKPLPSFPFHVGIITSGSGAVIHDILKTGRMRNPAVRYTLYNSTVQGENAAKQLADMVEVASLGEDVPDILIIARGGGAEEDLQVFNEKVLLEAVYHCPIPIISAVGHETDTTLVDLAADVRASTPTQAAEIGIPLKETILQQIQKTVNDMQHSLDSILKEERIHLERWIQSFLISLKEQHMDYSKTDIYTICLSMKNQVQSHVAEGYKNVGKEMLILLEKGRTTSHGCKE